MLVTLDVNGEQRQVDVAPHRRLVSVLRDDLGLHGTKDACGEGACGACAVLLDGRAVASCLMLASMAVGHRLTTIEGLGGAGPTTAVQQAFQDEDALQCGFCTPGQVIGATALLAREPRPTHAQIRSSMAAHLCRCGAYPRIERAVLRATALLSE